ncbi:hypothetical protein GCM10009764_76050 [Nocardia ninae]|uniref:Uncharacterized protein n=1 Tax=Nocardia ninae NBRC 108245 TaxID=1210091 RepID=A0A511MNR5_9NOCA|nr:hypothetical protein NN4_61250 [Nocardia ninae NBRC 108245]
MRGGHRFGQIYVYALIGIDHDTDLGAVLAGLHEYLGNCLIDLGLMHQDAVGPE